MELKKSELEKWIDGVGRTLPAIIDMSKSNVQYGSPELGQWFGLCDPRVKLWDKLKMVWKNG